MKTALWRKTAGTMRCGGEQGAILGMVLVIVLALSLLGLGLLQLGRVNAVEVARAYNLNKAFWAAEAGIFHARAMLRGSSTFRASPQPLSSVDPAYGVTATPEGDGVYTVRSTGTVQSASRVVWQTLFAGELPPAAFNYALFGGEGLMDLRMHPTIDGSVFNNGPINFMPPATVTNGTVTGTDPANISPSTLPIEPTPDPVPAFPVFDPGPAGAGYDALISTASGAGVVTNTLGAVNLGGATNYVKSSDLSLMGNITGPGMLVVSGDVSLDANITLSPNVHIISGGKLDLNCDTCMAGSNCLIFARTAVTASKDVAIGTVTLITMGDIAPGGGLNKNLTFMGVLYCAGQFNSKKDLFVTGSILAGEGIDIAKDFSVTYSNLWPVPLLPGFTAEVVVTNINWREVFE